jgi:hypothetical protein
MSRHHPVRSLLVAIAAPLALAACGGGFLQAQYPIAHRISPDQGLTQYSDPLLNNAVQNRVSYLGAFEHIDYVRLESSEVVLESVYDVATSVKTVLDYTYTMTRMTDTWNLNNGKAKSWGKPETLRAWHGSVDYRPYTLIAENRRCVAFESEWAFQPLDILGRPGRIYFGYVCAQPGKTVSTQALVKIVASVRLNGESPESMVPVDGRSSIDPAAISEAKGAPGGATGNAEFPFNFGTVYQEGDNERST